MRLINSCILIPHSWQCTFLIEITHSVSSARAHCVMHCHLTRSGSCCQLSWQREWLLGKTATAVWGFSDWHSIHLAAQCIRCRWKKCTQQITPISWELWYETFHSGLPYSITIFKIKYWPVWVMKNSSLTSPGSLCRCCILINNDRRR